MDIETIRQMNDEELKAKLKELKDEQAELRMQKVVAPPENPMRIRHIRKSIARIKTVQRERELEEAQEAS
ncbi:MAG: 50S ribosomal protein L29 [bacterium]